MNKGLREGIIFVSGVILGSATTFVFAKKYFEKKSQEEIASVEKAFTEKINELEDENDNIVDAARDAILNANGYNKDDPGANEFLRNRSTLEGFIRTSQEERTNYQAYFEKNSKETIEVDDAPPEGDDSDTDYSDGSGNDGDGNSGSENSSEGKIYEISYDEYGSRPGWDFKEIYYYQGDGVVVDDDEQFIDNPYYLLGDVIKESGFADDATRNIYIRNEIISMDFEVMKVEGSYA